MKHTVDVFDGSPSLFPLKQELAAKKDIQMEIYCRIEKRLESFQILSSFFFVHFSKVPEPKTLTYSSFSCNIDKNLRY
jgi:hypothetical protein